MLQTVLEPVSRERSEESDREQPQSRSSSSSSSSSDFQGSTSTRSRSFMSYRLVQHPLAPPIAATDPPASYPLACVASPSSFLPLPSLPLALSRPALDASRTTHDDGFPPSRLYRTSLALCSSNRAPVDRPLWTVLALPGLPLASSFSPASLSSQERVWRCCLPSLLAATPHTRSRMPSPKLQVLPLPPLPGPARAFAVRLFSRLSPSSSSTYVPSCPLPLPSRTR